MNAHQRRKAYRAMPKPGVVVQWRGVIGSPIIEGVSAGPFQEASWLKPSVHRLAVRVPEVMKHVCAPLVRKVFVKEK